MAPVAVALRPFRRPRLWVALWALAIAVTVLVCLLPGPSLPQVPRGGDKLEHLLAYALLAAWAVQLFASRVALWRAAAGLFGVGVLIEILQGTLTTTRSADAADALADAAGIALGMLLARTPARGWLLALDQRLPARG